MTVCSKKEFEETLIKCVDELAEYVVSTYGPHGQNVLLYENGKALLTKDGVTVAKSMKGQNDIEDAIYTILKQCAEKTVLDAGDGTTTSILLTQAFVHELLSVQKMFKKIPKMELYEAFRSRVEKLCQQLEIHSQPIDSKELLYSVASVASNGDKQISELVTELVDLVGLNGTVSIKEAKDKETSLKILEGVRIGSKILSNAFLADNQEKLVLTDCIVVVSKTKIDFSQDILNLLTNINLNKKSVLFVCPDMDEKILLTLAANTQRGSIRACVICPSYMGHEKLEVLEDIASVCGTVACETSLLNRTTIEEWGYAKTIEITRNLCTIIDGKAGPEQMDSIVETLKKRIKATEDEFIINKLIARINRLTSTIGVLYVGGQTPGEATERRFRAEDALESCNSAMRKGVIPGGGTTIRYLANVATSMEPFGEAIDSAINSVCKLQSYKLYGTEKMPFKTDDKFITQVLDLRTSKFVDWKNGGVIESVWTVQSALQNAFATAWLLCNTFGVVTK